jgi:predicted aspartyl protease
VTENGGTVIKEITPITVDILGHEKRVNFDITRTSTYDAVLGLSWLEKHNLTINYKKRTMVFDGCDCTRKPDIDIEKMLVRVINVYYR